MKLASGFAILFLTCFGSAAATTSNLVANGSFEAAEGNSQVPDFWSAAGNRSIKQMLQLDTGADGGRCARLECTEFSGNGGDYHAMICQVGQVQVRKGQWYRIRFQAKGTGLRSAVEVALVNRRPWANVGLDEVFLPDGYWKTFEFLFQAPDDLPAATSRLQFWFTSTGTLWLDNVELVETSERRRWLPQISSEGVKNLLPNSSFECGGANWGSFTYGLKGWAGNLFRLEGEIDTNLAQHGTASWKISSAPAPIFYFDYYEPIRQPVRRILLANHGWLQVKPGEKLTFSAWVRASREGIRIEMLVNEAPDHQQRKLATATKEWQRHEFTFTPDASSLFVAMGPDFGESQASDAAVWLDALQLERGDHATDYEPREPVESFIVCETNLFLQPHPSLKILAWNNTSDTQLVRGRVSTADFFDSVIQNEEQAVELQPHSGKAVALSGVPSIKQGFFRANWSTGTSTQSVRYVISSPLTRKPADCPFAMNHAYPWQFLIGLAQHAGVGSWRDWSAKWNTVEPKKEQFDFTEVDPQIDRVIAQGGEIDLLLPFPSAAWSTSASESQIEKIAGHNEGEKARLKLACAPRDEKDFAQYARKVAEHYASMPAVSHIEILNEPLYTDYALPRQLGYGLADYIALVNAGAPALRAGNPKCKIIAGIGSGPAADLTRQFVTEGGLAAVDILDLHLYDAPIPIENFEPGFRSLEELIRHNGQAKPIWITEWGCYADDDPASLPPTVGDSSMNHCLWPNELAATEAIVKFTAVTFAHGVRKIFFHAGVCGAINEPDMGSVFFEYGGAPRKMFAGAAALTRILGVPRGCSKIINANSVHAYIFETDTGSIAIGWCSGTRAFDLKLGDEVQAFDIMGNQTENRAIKLQQSPIYFQARHAEAIARVFGQQ